jgi:hypothetical protein
MSILEFFKKYNFRGATYCCANCIYHKNTIPHAPYLDTNIKYCDHPELRDQQIPERMISDVGYCDAFEMTFGQSF